VESPAQSPVIEQSALICRNSEVECETRTPTKHTRAPADVHDDLQYGRNKSSPRFSGVELQVLRIALKEGYHFAIFVDLFLLLLQTGSVLEAFAAESLFPKQLLLGLVASFSVVGGCVGFQLSRNLKEPSALKSSIVCALPIIGPLKIMVYHSKVKRILANHD
jgi:hypothetical protein